MPFLKRLAARVLRDSRLCTLLTIQRQGYKLRFHPSSFSAGLWVDPGIAVRDEAFIRRYLRPGDVMVDIGANIGTITLTAASIAAQVFSIEAHPRTFSYLKENVELNSCTNVHLVNVALGAEASTLHFSNLRDDDLNHIAEEGLSVRVIPLDELSFPAIALLKIDVEGFERFVFEGGKNTLGKVACVYFESFAPQYARYNYTCNDVFQLLRDHGFEIYQLVQSEVRPVPVGHESAVCENLIACRDLTDFFARTGYRLPSQPSSVV